MLNALEEEQNGAFVHRFAAYAEPGEAAGSA
jgi:hypothetical protein